MGQRISIILQGLVAIAVITTCVIIWNVSQENSRAQAALMTALVESQKESNVALVEQLASLKLQAPSPVSMEWLPLSFHLVDEAGAPVQGSVITSSRAPGGFNQSMRTDPEGKVDFGLLPAGAVSWSVHLDSPQEWCAAELILGPGRPSEVKIVCPTKPPVAIEGFRIDPPKELQSETTYLVAEITYVGREFAGRQWSSGASLGNSPQRTLLVGPDGRWMGDVDPQLVGTQTVAMFSRQMSDMNWELNDLHVTPGAPVPAYTLSIALAPYLVNPNAKSASEIPALYLGWRTRTPDVFQFLSGEPWIEIPDSNSFWARVSERIASIQSRSRSAE